MAFVGFLKQSTSVTVTIGQFLDETDGKTAETALTISQSDVRLSKNGGAGAQKNDTNSATHDENGKYLCALNTTDTGTLGLLTLTVNESGALPIRHDYMVLPAHIYNGFVLNTGNMNVNVDTVGGSATNAANLAAVSSASITGTSDNTGFTATSTTMDSTITEATTDHFKGRIINFTSGALLGQSSDITGYSLVSGRGRFVFTALTEAVPNGTTFVIT